MKCKTKTMMWVFVVVLASLVFSLTIEHNTEADFLSGTFTNTTYNSTGGYIQLGQRAIGQDDLNNTFDWGNDIIVYYPLDSNCTDFFNNYNCTSYSLRPYTDGVINYSARFEKNSNDYITISDEDVFSFGNGTEDKPFSVAFWVKSQSFDATANFIVAKDDPAGTREWQFLFLTATTLGFGLWDESENARIRRDDTAGFSVDTWYHVVGVYNGNGSSSGISLYVNGVRADDTTSDSGSYTAMENGAEKLTIGKYDDATPPYILDGWVDELAIFNRTLSPTEISNLYQAQVGNYTAGTYTNSITQAGATWNNITFFRGTGWELHDELDGDERLVSSRNNSNLIAYWDMNDENNTILDYSGNNYNGNITSGSNVNYTGKLNNAVNFTDVNSEHIGVSGLNPMTAGTSDVVSASLWYYHIGDRASLATQGGMIGKRDVFLFGFESSVSGADGREFTVATFGSNIDSVTCSKPTVSQWHHLYFEYNEVTDNLSIYLNGQLDCFGSSSDNSGTSAYNFDIGAVQDQAGTYLGMKGALDEIKLYNRSLSPAEILLDYKAGITRLNLSTTNGTSTVSTGFGSTYLNISSLSGDTINYTAWFETDNSSYSPELYNVTVDYTAGGTPTITNYPSLISTVVGTNTTADDFTRVYSDDGVYHNVTETVGAPGFDIRANFSDWTAFNRTYIEYDYDGSAGHVVNLQFMNTSGSWVTIGQLPETTGTELHSFNITNYQVYNNSGVVVTRIYHVTAGNINHHFAWDYMNLSLETPVTVQVQSNLTNLTLTSPASVITNQDFNVSYSFSCSNNDLNCTNVVRTINTTPSSGCTLQAPYTASYSYGNMTPGQTISNITIWTCPSVGEYQFNITISSDNNTISDTTNTTIEVSGLTDEESSCLLTGFYTNGTKCAIGEAKNEMTLGTSIFALGLILIGLFLILRKKNV